MYHFLKAYTPQRHPVAISADQFLIMDIHNNWMIYDHI